MNLFTIYTFLTGSKAAFLNNFEDNGQLYAQAQSFWGALEGSAYIYLVEFLVLGVGLALYYYGQFNEQPGRHYKPKFWWIGMGLCFLLTLIATFIAAYLIADPKLTGTLSIEFRLALANGLYAVGIYFITSVIYCNLNLPTNAYRYLKL